MTSILFGVLACTSPPEAKEMGPSAACYTLKDEVPEKCHTMGMQALAGGDREAAAYGLTYACNGGVLEACSAAADLPGIGVEPLDASLVVFTACIEQQRKPACKAYLSLIEKTTSSTTPKLIARAKAILASTPESPPSEPAND